MRYRKTKKLPVETKQCWQCSRASGMMVIGEGMLFPVVFCPIKTKYCLLIEPSCKMFEDKNK